MHSNDHAARTKEIQLLMTSSAIRIKMILVNMTCAFRALVHNCALSRLEIIRQLFVTSATSKTEAILWPL